MPVTPTRPVGFTVKSVPVPLAKVIVIPELTLSIPSTTTWSILEMFVPTFIVCPLRMVIVPSPTTGADGAGATHIVPLYRSQLAAVAQVAGLAAAER